ncbi:MAG TPA: hypothetical protein VKT74_02475 [Gammaproteobacteria bacterium]|nr:hypothetical protein [Gammaproteobacteria bacterium]
MTLPLAATLDDEVLRVPFWNTLPRRLPISSNAVVVPPVPVVVPLLLFKPLPQEARTTASSRVPDPFIIVFMVVALMVVILV